MVATLHDFFLAPGFTPALDWALANQPEGLEEIGCPVTIAWGEKDRLLPLRQAGRFTARIPRARARILPGVGHVPMSDDAELVASAILESIA